MKHFGEGSKDQIFNIGELCIYFDDEYSEKRQVVRNCNRRT